MLQERWRRIESLFLEALAKAPEDRADFLDQACSTDRELRQEIESLLVHEGLASRFLESGESPGPADSGPGDPVPAGHRIGPYSITEPLGVGGMGEVYKAYDERLDRYVAVKFLSRRMADDAASLERFGREARAASALNHPNICTVHDVGESQGRRYIVMELLEGQSLKERLAEGPLSIQELASTARQVCAALGVAHEKGIVHRDLKPANIFVTASGTVKVLDFGLAKTGAEISEPGDQIPDATQSVTLTAAGTILGTLAYMSPEQALGKNVDTRSDIFALGVVFYEMAAGRRPFRGKTPAGILGSILTESPEKPSSIKAGIPAGLDRVILKAIEKEPARRYQSVAELSSDLPRWQEGEPLRTRRWVLATSAAGVAGMAGVAWLGRSSIFGGRRRIRVAVLPLDDPGADASQAYFARGLHTQMIRMLSRLYPERLGVIQGSSATRYRGTTTPLRQIGTELGVDYIVRGEVRRLENHVNISARLIRAKDEAELWSAAFDRDLSHILALQADVAQGVAQGIEKSLRPNPQVTTAEARALDPQAYEAYLRGDYAKSVEIDPYYAPAYVGLANKVYLPALFGFVPPQPAFSQMMDAASKAVELDATLADAHAALAMARLHTQWQWREAESGFRKAVQLEPNNADVRHGFAHFLLWAGRGRESAEQCNVAQELDPFDPDLLACRAWHDLWAGQYDQALEASRRALSFQRDHGLALAVMGWTYEQKGMFAEAISAFGKAARGRPPGSSASHVLARAGHREEAEGILQRVLQESKTRYVSPYDIAIMEDGLGRKDEVFSWLNKAYEEHSGFLVYVYLDPRLRSLHGDARFRDLLHRMGFEKQA